MYARPPPGPAVDDEHTHQPTLRAVPAMSPSHDFSPRSAWRWTYQSLAHTRHAAAIQTPPHTSQSQSYPTTRAVHALPARPSACTCRARTNDARRSTLDPLHPQLPRKHTRTRPSGRTSSLDDVHSRPRLDCGQPHCALDTTRSTAALIPASQHATRIRESMRDGPQLGSSANSAERRHVCSVQCAVCSVQCAVTPRVWTMVGYSTAEQG
ncbi:hypothetical protein SVAN01_09576 [Stagonosporopsis vannaccii]|nr:hypothetical protein SVAN01_09576 [Stagonosporopsis vannaccii]